MCICDHDVVKDYIDKLFKYYGVDSRKEVIIGNRRIDNVGYYGGKSICVEISKSSPLQKDLDSLLESGCDYKFIIWCKPEKKPADIIKDIWIVSSLKEFEYILRSLLKVDISKPPYPVAPPIPIKGWKYRSFEDFKDLMESLGLSNLFEPVKVLLLKMLALGEIEIEYIKYSPYSEKPEIMRSLENPEAIAILKQLGLISERSRGTYLDGKTFTASLVEEGKDLAHIIAQHEVENNKEFIEGIIKKHGIIISFIASYNKGSRLWMGNDNYLEAAENLGWGILESVEQLNLGTLGPLRDAEAPPLHNFLVHAIFLPRINKLCTSFMREFKEKYLAFESKGEIRLVPELCELIIKNVRDKAIDRLKNIVGKFNTLSMLYTLAAASYRRIKMDKGYKQKLMQILSINEDELISLTQELHEKGVTSKLIEDTPFIVVLNWGKFLEILGEKLKEIEEEIITINKLL